MRAPDLGRIEQAYNAVYDPNYKLITAKLKKPYNPLKEELPDRRARSVYTGDIQLGDTGKGQATLLLIEKFRELYPDEEVVTYRYNGSHNSGHIARRDGLKIAFHVLPVGALLENTRNYLGGGMLIHPPDLGAEMKNLIRLKGKIPGKVIIDGNALVSTDVHRAFEAFAIKKTEEGKGSTSSGVSQGYAEMYTKNAKRMYMFLEDGWEDLYRKQYRYYNDLMGGGDALARSKVKYLKDNGERDEREVGTEDEFIERLQESVDFIKDNIREDIADELEELWYRTKKPFVLEGAQSDGLDPVYGIYPDITASRPVGRVGIPDSTRGVIKWKHIMVRGANIKIPYMTSVGSRVPPYPEVPEAEEYRGENEEWGASTGRKRLVLPEDYVMSAELAESGEYTDAFTTHNDAVRLSRPIHVVKYYINKETGRPEKYKGSQRQWDRVRGEEQMIDRTWDGEKARHASSMDELPREAVLFNAFTAEAHGLPVMMMVKGPGKGDVIFAFDE